MSENPHTQIFSYCKGTIETGDPVVSIYLNSADVTTYIDSEENAAQLDIAIYMPDQHNIDDALDTFAHCIRNALCQHPNLNKTVIEQRHTRWTYDRTSFTGWTGLILTYTLNY